MVALSTTRVCSRRSLLQGVAGAGALAVSGLAANRRTTAQSATPVAARPIDRIEHLIVIYQENWSFDGLYGQFPGADGHASAGDAVRQLDGAGVPYERLPQPIDTSRQPPAPDPRFPSDLPVAPFDLSGFVPPDQPYGDMVHRFYQEQLQINGGRMDRFVAVSDAAGLVMSYYDATDMPEGRLAREFTLADRFFHAAFGGSFLNHIWLVCACTPVWPDAPSELFARVAADGSLLQDGTITPDGYVVNTLLSVNPPHPRFGTPRYLLPEQRFPTIGDRLSERGVSWAWYAGGWSQVAMGPPVPYFQYHHQPFVYFASYGEGTPGRAEHLKDEREFVEAARTGTLPSVAFVKPIGDDNEHPGYASLLRGQQHVAELVAMVRSGPNWHDTAIIITYDENGGRWDHVAPPVGDRWGPGTRVPAIIVSPYARRGYVDSTTYDTTSILRTIEVRWGLAPLGSRDAAANDLRNAFAFDRVP